MLLPDHGAESVSWSPDSARVATAQDHLIKVWDWQRGKQLLTLYGHRDKVESVAWSPDGRLIASGSTDLTTRIWDAASGRELISLAGHSGSILSVAWSRDGRRLASSGIDGVTQIYAVSIHELMDIARRRVTRNLTTIECQSYLHVDRCPAIPILESSKRPANSN